MKVKIFCNNCSGKRNHDNLFHEEVEWSEEIDKEFYISGSNSYDLFRCCGCERVVFRHRSWDSEDIDPETGRPEIYDRYYPPPTFRNLPSWVTELCFITTNDGSIYGLMYEISIALQNDAPRLATMGIRALLEIVMIDSVGDNGSFTANLKAFQEEGYISQKQKKVIEPIIEAGHATIHRSFSPTKKDVVQLMDVTESIIEAIYINESRVKKLAEKIPKRQKQVTK